MDLTCKNTQKKMGRRRASVQALFKGMQYNQTRTGGCASGYKITLFDSIGMTNQPDTAGDYVEICSDNGKPIYR